MSDPGSRCRVLAAVWAAAALVPSTVFAQPSAPASKAESPAGSFLHRAAGQSGFAPLPAAAAVSPGDLLVALPGAALASANGAVGLASRADFEGTSPLPVLETALAVNPPDGVDLDVTLDRGRIDLVNRKASGRAAARVRFQKLVWVIGLDAPDSRVAVEAISRWPAGSAFHRDPMDGHEPVGAVVLIVLAGSADVSDGKTTLALTAPPGPAMVEWTSAAETRLAAVKLDALPAWADPTGANPAVKAARDAAEALRERFAGGVVGPSIDALLASDNPAEKHVGLIAAGATDDLDRLTNAIAETADPATWDFGVSVLRHWVGRTGGQDVALFKYLVEARTFTPAQAETAVRLLHGFDAEDRTRPEVYEVLIGYLQSERAALRNLAEWHLARMVPAGKDIPFRPNASRAECDAAYRAWKKLIPAGQLPPEPKADAAAPRKTP